MQDNKTKVVGYLFLLNGNVVSAIDKNTVICDDPVTFAGKISDNGADEIIVLICPKQEMIKHMKLLLTLLKAFARK